MTRVVYAVAAGVLLGAVATVTPLTLVVAATTAGLVIATRRGLDPDERRAVTAILLAGIAVRILIVLALAVVSIPTTSFQGGGMLFGDEAYAFEKALRARNIALGFPATVLDHYIVSEPYTKSHYTTWFTWIQLIFGPSNYSVRLLNSLMFVAAGAGMYRLARRGFGVVPALYGLAILLFVPTLALWSVSLMKESFYFLFTTLALAGTVAVVRGRSWRARLGGCAVVAVSLWAIADVRSDAVPLTLGGILLGLGLYWATATRRRLAVVAVSFALVCAGVAWSAPGSARLLRVLNVAARQHAGHVATPGHAYKTLDDRFYPGMAVFNESPLTRPEAVRYVTRATSAFVLEPLPWHAASRSELAFIPEQLLWYVLVGLAVAGVYPAWRRDRLMASVLIGYIVPVAAALALVNGNIGTLVRLRGLVLRFVIWIAALGFIVIVQRLLPDKIGRCDHSSTATDASSDA